MLVLIAQIKRFGTLNATQKTAALYKAPCLKKSRKTARNWLFLTKNALLTIFRQFFLIFTRTVLCRGLWFFLRFLVETLWLQCKLTLVNSTPSICTQTRPNCDNNSVCLAKHFTKNNRILHWHVCGACDKFHVCYTLCTIVNT